MRPHENGIALIIAVWAVILIGGFVTGMVVMGGSDAAITGNRIEAARAQALAEAGVARAIEALADPQSREKLPLGQPFTVQLEDAAEITVEVRDSCGSIDLNWAPEPLLQAYAVTAGLKSDAAGRFSAAIVARRETASTNGKDELHSGPWQSLDQLAGLPGLSAATFQALRSGLTINCREAGADPHLASGLVLQALGKASVRGSPSHGMAYEIQAKASLASGAKATIEAAIWLSRMPGSPFYYVTGWRTL
jgi:general secretion pathway protein K